MFPYSDECPLEVQQLRFGLREISVVTTQLEHPQHQHQGAVLRHKQREKMSELLICFLKPLGTQIIKNILNM